MSHAFARLQTDDYVAKLNQCVHCGLCLQACPTYAVFGTEMDSPRGRIVLMRAAAEGRIAEEEIGGAFATHITRCLACRSCETACPSGVQYGALVEQARIVVEQNRTPSAAERFVRWVGLREMMPKVGRLKLMSSAMRLYETSGAQRLVRGSGLLPESLAVMEGILPPLAANANDYSHPAPAIGPKRGRVAFFYGCIQEAFLGHVNAATVRVLQQNGYEVVFPPAQTCCGAAQAHIGDEAAAQELARRNIAAFAALEVDAIITNAGGCGAALKEFAHILRDDPVYGPKAKDFVASVQDISEFLAAHLHTPPTGEVRLRATYADSCHLRHAQKIVRQPREILRSIPGLQLVELSQPDRCCGSAGVYNIVQPEIADTLLDMKMADIAATGAEVIVTTNTGCHMQYYVGVRRSGLNARVMHLVEVLDLSYQNART
ncbi:MAG: heterodisulfide reductase-related iron-sulfur binding cluster [Anaerolineae bacterium]